MEFIDKGVCAPRGFRAGAVHCGIKKGSTKDDLAVIVSDVLCNAASVYTTNKVKAAPIYVTMEHLKDGLARAIVVNSGNANACAPMGHENAIQMCKTAGEILGIDPHNIVVASTGVIGQTINIEAIKEGLPKIPNALSENGSDGAAVAIMTTDLVKKEVAVKIEIGGKTVKIGAIAKGSGMIHPNMGTMLCFVTTDCHISSEILNEMLKDITRKSFNRVSVDGDTSTNDMCTVLANGLASNDVINKKGEDYDIFYNALKEVCITLAKAIAADGEGATKLITCTVKNAKSEDVAETLSKSVAASSLVKTAMFGADANWGRVLCAMGYSGADFHAEKVNVGFKSKAGEISVCQNGMALDFDEDKAKEILTQKNVEILIDINDGQSEVSAWGCDLTYDYVKINGDYRT